MRNPRIIFQQLIPADWDEYTADIYFNKHGYLCSCIPRKRIETRSGEISKGQTKKGNIYKFLLDKFKFIKGARGVITIQIFADKKQESFYAIEINPRFGGGYPMSHYAGADFPKLIFKEYLFDEEINSNDKWEKDILFLRYDSTKIIKNSGI